MIKQLRYARELSQEQLAEQAGLSLRTIQRAEAGHRVSYASLRALAEVFNLDVDELEWELYAMKKSLDEFTELPLWARLLLRKSWYTPSRSLTVVTEKALASVFLLCLILYLTPFFEGETIHTTMDLPLEYQILIAGFACLMSAYWLSLITRLSDYYQTWESRESADKLH